MIYAGFYAITINDTALSSELVAMTTDVRVESNLNLPTLFEIKLNIADFLTELDLLNIAPGDSVSISMGLTELQPLVVGRITELDINLNDEPVLLIRGYDDLYRLHFGLYTRAFYDSTDIQMAQTIARELELEMGMSEDALAETESISYAYVLQNNQSNYDFLRQRAALINYEMLIDQGKFWFRPSQEGLAPSKTLSYPENLLSVELNLRVLTQGSTVTALSWNMLTKETVQASTETATPQEYMQGETVGQTISLQFPAAPVQLAEVSTTAITGLETIAKAQYQRLLSYFIGGEVVCEGDPGLRAGTNLLLQGLGTRFSGLYYITETQHLYAEQEGYQTRLKVRRTGI